MLLSAARSRPSTHLASPDLLSGAVALTDGGGGQIWVVSEPTTGARDPREGSCRAAVPRHSCQEEGWVCLRGSQSGGVKRTSGGCCSRRTDQRAPDVYVVVTRSPLISALLLCSSSLLSFLSSLLPLCSQRLRDEIAEVSSEIENLGLTEER